MFFSVQYHWIRVSHDMMNTAGVILNILPSKCEILLKELLSERFRLIHAMMKMLFRWKNRVSYPGLSIGKWIRPFPLFSGIHRMAHPGISKVNGGPDIR